MSSTPSTEKSVEKTEVKDKMEVKEKTALEKLFEQARKDLEAEDPAYIAGMIAGVIWRVTSGARDSIVTHPLSTLAGFGFYGVLCGLGAAAVSAFLLPKPVKVLIPMALAVSSYHYLTKWLI